MCTTKHQLVELHRLIEIFADAERFGIHLVPATLIARDHNDKGFGVARLFRLDFFQDQKPAAARKHHIEHDQVGIAFFRQLDGLIAVACRFDDGAGRIRPLSRRCSETRRQRHLGA